MSGGPKAAVGAIKLIDAIGPFFRDYRKRRVNWSKIPFHHLPTGGLHCEDRWQRIAQDLTCFVRRVKLLGFTAVTLDDLIHLVDHPAYEPEVADRIRAFRDEFRKLFALIRSLDMGIYITSDYLSTSPLIDERIAGDPDTAAEWFRGLVGRFLADFPEVDGVILRIGESDGTDVKDRLRSRLTITNASQVNSLLESILPLFERSGRTLILRTWTVGTGQVGDLIWHPRRALRALEGIDSPALIISMKPGDSDFFRHLPLNPLFHQIRLPKIIELQARREYEGAGEYPSFIGWQCERLARELEGAENMVGYSVWCQTGGWHRFRRLAFLGERPSWTELNVEVVARVMEGATAEAAVRGIVGPERAPAALRLLELADDSVRNLLYIGPFARQSLYFRRVRIPPLLYVYWDSIFINSAIREVMRFFIADHRAALAEGEKAFTNFIEMERLAEKAGWPVEDIRFMRDTFHIVLLARRYILQPECADLRQQIVAAKRNYKATWPSGSRPRYRIKTTAMNLPVKPAILQFLMRLLFRRGSGYRPILDEGLTLRVLPAAFRFIERRGTRSLPKFARKSAMGIGSLFR